MSMSSIDLCSRALIKIGANPISSFDDGTIESQVSGSLYPLVRDGLLTSHPWNFATSQRSLARLIQTPIADFANSFPLPSDCLRVLSAGPSGRGHGLTYRVRENLLLTDADDVVITYICRPPETRFPAFFNIALVARLAAEFCIPLTDSTSRWTSLHEHAEHELKRARLSDALEDTPLSIEEFNLVEGRY